MRPASDKDWTAFCLHLRCPIITTVIKAGTNKSGTNSMRCSVKLGTSDLATNQPEIMAAHVRNSKNTSRPMAGRSDAHCFIRPGI